MDSNDEDFQLSGRIDDLIESGLECYGSGDMEGALSSWEHALALDPDSERAANYLEYIEGHQALAPNGAARSAIHSDSRDELAYPFGVAPEGMAEFAEEEGGSGQAGAELMSSKSSTCADLADDQSLAGAEKAPAVADEVRAADDVSTADDSSSAEAAPLDEVLGVGVKVGEGTDAFVLDGTPDPFATVEVVELDEDGDETGEKTVEISRSNLLDDNVPSVTGKTVGGGPGQFEGGTAMTSRGGAGDDVEDEQEPTRPVQASEDKWFGSTDVDGSEVEKTVNYRAPLRGGTGEKIDIDQGSSPTLNEDESDFSPVRLALESPLRESSGTIEMRVSEMRVSDAERAEREHSLSSKTIEISQLLATTSDAAVEDADELELGSSDGVDVERDFSSYGSEPGLEVELGPSNELDADLDAQRGDLDGLDVGLEVELASSSGFDVGLEVELASSTGLDTGLEVELAPSGGLDVESVCGELPANEEDMAIERGLPDEEDMTIERGLPDEEDMTIERGLPDEDEDEDVSEGEATVERAIAEVTISVDDALLSLEDEDTGSGGSELGDSEGSSSTLAVAPELCDVDLAAPGASENAESTEAKGSTVSPADTLAIILLEARGEDEGRRELYVVSRLVDFGEKAFLGGRLMEAAEAVCQALDHARDCASSQKLVFESERRLVQILISSLGDAGHIPRLLVPLTEIPSDHINSRAAFLLSRLDGSMTFDELLDVSGMPRMEALRHLCGLFAQGYLEVT